MELRFGNHTSHNMQAIIEPVSRDLLRRELTPELQLRKTNKAGNEIYIITHHNAPNVMRENRQIARNRFPRSWRRYGTSLGPR